VTVVTAEGDKIVGAIPFDLRDFLIRPGLSIRSAWAHMVCVDAEYRSRGIGSGMMKLGREQLASELLAGQHLPRICEAMFVYTGSEGTPPYTFYEKNGFVDLHYSRFYTLTGLKANAPLEVQVTPFDPARIGEKDLYAAYQRAYQAYAGFPVHYPGYWQRAIASIIYIEIPTEFYIATLTQETELSGYAIFGFIRGYATILELAADPAEPGLIEKLLQAVIAAAAARGVEMVNMLACTHHPAASALLEIGFQPDRRANAEVIAGVVLEFDRLWNKLAGENPPFGLDIWTPSRTLKLPGLGKPITLEMKESTLQRLFLCREDLPAALETERITSPHLSLPLEALQRIFQPARWVLHWLEWI